MAKSNARFRSFTLPEGFLGVPLRQRIADGALQAIGVKPGLDQVIHRACPHRSQVLVVVARAREHDHGRVGCL